MTDLHSHGDFIVLPHWETKPLAPCPDIPLSEIILTLSQPLTNPNNTERQARKQNVSIFNASTPHMLRIPRIATNGYIWEFVKIREDSL